MRRMRKMKRFQFFKRERYGKYFHATSLWRGKPIHGRAIRIFNGSATRNALSFWAGAQVSISTQEILMRFPFGFLLPSNDITDNAICRSIRFLSILSGCSSTLDRARNANECVFCLHISVHSRGVLQFSTNPRYSCKMRRAEARFMRRLFIITFLRKSYRIPAFISSSLTASARLKAKPSRDKRNLEHIQNSALFKSITEYQLSNLLTNFIICPHYHLKCGHILSTVSNQRSIWRCIHCR